MTAVHYTRLGKNLKEYCDKVINDEAVIITRGDEEENVVLISEKEYNNMIENLHIRSSENNYKILMKSIEQLKAGKGSEHELIEADL